MVFWWSLWNLTMGGWALICLCRVVVHCEVSHHSTSVKVQYARCLQYLRYHCIAPVYGFFVPCLLTTQILPLKWSSHNKDVVLVAILVLVGVPGSVEYPIPYACQLAFLNAGMYCCVPQWFWCQLSCWQWMLSFFSSVLPLSTVVLQPLLSRVFCHWTLG